MLRNLVKKSATGQAEPVVMTSKTLQSSPAQAAFLGLLLRSYTSYMYCTPVSWWPDATKGSRASLPAPSPSGTREPRTGAHEAATSPESPPLGSQPTSQREDTSASY